MAFSSTIAYRGVMGNMKISRGTYTSNGGSTGGDINTGLISCRSIVLQPTGSAVGTNQSKVNETLPMPGNAITIVTDADQAGNWAAEGY